MEKIEQFYTPEYAESTKARVQEIFKNDLPEELLERAEEENWNISKINKVIEQRKQMGLQVIRGFHTSDIDLPEGQTLVGDVFYSNNFQNLYGRKADWLYIIDGAANDEIVNEGLGWQKSRGNPRKIIQKIKLTDEVINALGASFAKVEYR